MKKFLCVLVLFAFVSSSIIMTGCGSSGSSSGSSIGGLLSAALVITAIASTGGTSAAFVASSRNMRLNDRTASENYIAELYINGEKIQKEFDVVRTDEETLELLNPIEGEDIPSFHAGDKTEYKIVFRHKSSGHGLTVYGAKTLTGGQNAIGDSEEPIKADVKSTAKALAYERWKATNALLASDKTFDAFEAKLPEDLSALEGAVSNDLKNVIESAGEYTAATTDAADTAIAEIKATPSTDIEFEGGYTFIETIDGESEKIYFFIDLNEEEEYELVFTTEDEGVQFAAETVVDGDKVYFRLDHFEGEDRVVGTGTLTLSANGTFTGRVTVTQDGVTETDTISGTKATADTTASNPSIIIDGGYYVYISNEAMPQETIEEYDSDPAFGIWFRRLESTTEVYMIDPEDNGSFSSVTFDEEDVMTFVGSNQYGEFTGEITWKNPDYAYGSAIQDEDEIFLSVNKIYREYQ